MSNQSDQTEESRAPLSRDSVLRAAIDLADEDGFESLTMRKLARSLGVEAMSLYYHVANKEAIVSGIVDIAFGEVELPSTDVDWKTAMHQRASSTRKVLAVHPWAITLMQSGSSPGPNLLRHHDAVIGVLRNAGFSFAMAGHAFSAIDAYIYGFAMQEDTLEFETAEELTAIAEMLLETVPPDVYPHLAEFMVKHSMKVGYDYDDEFEFGLNLILDGLETAENKAT